MLLTFKILFFSRGIVVHIHWVTKKKIMLLKTVMVPTIVKGFDKL